MKPSTYPHDVRYLELDEGDIYVLPDDAQLRFLVGQLEQRQEQLADMREAFAALKTKLGDKPDEKTLRSAEMEVSQMERSVQSDEDFIARMRALPEQYGKESKSYHFDMHRYSWHEKMLARDECRSIDDNGVAVINEKELVENLLAKCIDAWPTDEFGEINEENIRALPPGVIDAVYRKLVDRSEPSAARLAFLGTGSGRPAKGKSGQTRKDDV